MLLEVELPGRSETDILKHIKFYRTFIKELFQISAHFRNLSFFSENKIGKGQSQRSTDSRYPDSFREQPIEIEKVA